MAAAAVWLGLPGAQAPPLQDVLHDACPPVPEPLQPPLQCRSSQVHWDRARIARKGRWEKKTFECSSSPDCCRARQAWR